LVDLIHMDDGEAGHTSCKDNAEDGHVHIHGGDVNNVELVPAEENDDEDDIEEGRKSEAPESEIEESADPAGDSVYMHIYILVFKEEEEVAYS
jgi:hypothetical protein